MAPVSVALYIPIIVLNYVFIFFVFVFFLSYFLSFFFFFFATFSFIFSCFVPFWLSYLFLSLYSILMDLFPCFDIFKQFCYLAKCFDNTCKTYMYAKLKTSSLQNYILHKRKFTLTCWRARYDFLDVNK